MRVKIYPQESYVYEFLGTRKYRFEIVDKHENVLHYAGKSSKELLNLANEEKPDLVVMHKDALLKPDSPVRWVYQPAKNEKDLYNTKKVWTNAPSVAQLYFQRLGMQVEIETVSLPPKQAKGEVNFVFARWWPRIVEFMDWA